MISALEKRLCAALARPRAREDLMLEKCFGRSQCLMRRGSSFIWHFLVLGAVLIGAASTANAERRIALVIGINSYDSHRQLSEAVNDSRAMADTLKSLRFEVLHGENVTLQQFEALWHRFLGMIHKDDVAAIYFSGHGIEIDNINYLLPRDTPGIGTGPVYLTTKIMNLNALLFDLKRKQPSVSFVVIDACRDNPFNQPNTKSIGRDLGLAPIDPPQGIFVMYAAAQGAKALDRLSTEDPEPNSVYTRRLLPLLRTPGLTLQDVSQQVRREVFELAKRARPPHVQLPAYYDQLIPTGEPFCLAGCTQRIVPPASWEVIRGPPMAPCILGAVVQSARELFRIGFLVVEDAPIVQSIISRPGNQFSALSAAVKAGTVKRFVDPGILTIGILNVSQNQFPSKIRNLVGERICHGVVPVMGTPNGVEVSIPVGSGSYHGESSILVPRSFLEASPRPQICIEASFPVYRRGSIEEAYKHRPNVRCGFPGERPGSTSIGDALREGRPGLGLILIHRAG